MRTRTLITAVLIAAAVAVVLSYRAWLQPRSTEVETRPSAGASGSLSPIEARRTIGARDSQAAAALTARNIADLAALVHPSKGVRISHYTYVRPDSNVVFSAAELREAWGSPREYHWGEADGTGDPIRMPLRGYLEKYYVKDFAKAPRLGFNAPPIGTGNALNNIADVYPNAIVVEHHFPGFDEQYGGMDWQSLWLMYEEYRGAWYLVGIARGFWTI